MIKIPKILQNIIQSDAYRNKNNPYYAETNNQAAGLFQRFYPGSIEPDATGKFVAQDYDMTLEQFRDAQREIDSDFEEAKNLAADDFPEDEHIDIEQFVVPGERIAVKVLYPNGDIKNKFLETYELDISGTRRFR